MNVVLPAQLQPWMARLPMLLSVVLVLMIAYQLASATWAVVSPQAGMAVELAPAVSAEPPPDSEAIAARHLFGEANVAPHVGAIDAPETRLNLTLRGIAASGSPAYARALIAGPDAKENVYAVGAEVPGGALVHEIHADHVLLNRRGTLETLRLPKFSGDGSPAPPIAAQPIGAVAVDNLRNQAATDELVEIVRPQAVMVDGQLRGFRVYPGRDRQRFASLGLRAGDLVTAVNGSPLTDMAQSLEALRVLAGNGEISLTVERGDQIETVTVTP